MKLVIITIPAIIAAISFFAPSRPAAPSAPSITPVVCSTTLEIVQAGYNANNFHIQELIGVWTSVDQVVVSLVPTGIGPHGVVMVEDTGVVTTMAVPSGGSIEVGSEAIVVNFIPTLAPTSSAKAAWVTVYNVPIANLRSWTFTGTCWSGETWNAQTQCYENACSAGAGSGCGLDINWNQANGGQTDQHGTGSCDATRKVSRCGGVISWNFE